MTVEVEIRIVGRVSSMNNAEAAVAAIKSKAAQSSVDWTIEAVYRE
jgi:hypothetical protein